jgi:glycine/D-amino acid oxidase-like deaminating enzyme
MYLQSVWERGISPTDRPELTENLTADVAVIGAGMVGILTAFLLRRQGLCVVVLEADQIGSGVTRGTTAKITAQHGMIYHRLIAQLGSEIAGQYARANLLAVEQYANLILQEHIDCDFCRVSSYLYARSDARPLEREASAAKSLGLPVEFLPSAGLPFATVGAVRMHDQGQFHPLKFLYALSERLPVYCQTPVLELTSGRAETPHGSVQAKAIVVATHYPFLDLPGFYFAKMYQQRSYVLALADAPELGGMYYGAEDGYSMRDYQNLLLFGGCSHRVGKHPEGHCYQLLEQQAKLWFPEAKVVGRWSAQDCMTLDHLPYVGQYAPSAPGLYLASGFQKWGMTGSMAAAMLLCDLLTGRENAYAAAFTPNRFHLAASAKELAAHLGESVRGLTAGVFSKKERRCAHMGCRLQYNSDEDSWDCPCHGSRFGKDGALLDNPAEHGKRL